MTESKVTSPREKEIGMAVMVEIKREVHVGEEHQEMTKVLKMFERKDGNKSGDEKYQN